MNTGGSGSAATQGPAARAPSRGGSRTTSGDVSDTTRKTSRSGDDTSGSKRGRSLQGAGVVGPTGPDPAARADFEARVEGSTAGVTRQGGQEVFASSSEPKAAKRDKGSARGNAGAVSERTADRDLWSGVTSGSTNPSLASAAAGSEETGGLSDGMVAGMALLGLSLVAIAGAALLATAGRRRRAAGTAGGRRH